jgi:hypothetical protein
MIWIIVGVYWVVAGLACWMLPTPGEPAWKSPEQTVLEFTVCMVLGGFIVPARLLAKVIR